MTAKGRWLIIAPPPLDTCAADMNLAEVAAELRRAVADVDLTECSFALELEAMMAGVRRSKLELLAHRIGLSPDATGRLLDDWERRAQLMYAAHKLINLMIAGKDRGDAIERVRPGDHIALAA
jgi:hypothetical protein